MCSSIINEIYTIIIVHISNYFKAFTLDDKNKFGDL